MLKMNPNLKGNSTNAEKYAAFVEAVVTGRVIITFTNLTMILNSMKQIQYTNSIVCKKHICYNNIVKNSTLIQQLLQLRNHHYTPQWNKMKICDFPYDMILQVQQQNYG